MTYTLKIPVATMALLDGYCRAAGHSLKTALGLHLTGAATEAEADATAEAVSAATALPAAPAQPEPMPEPTPMTPDEEDAVLAHLGE